VGYEQRSFASLPTTHQPTSRNGSAHLSQRTDAEPGTRTWTLTWCLWAPMHASAPLRIKA